ncbi:MAG: hypothetical protein GXP49_18570 [Deltaproteobacteria bacterium]|nr:hypothetical protein [Deltaproteobacteria bacterium]
MVSGRGKDFIDVVQLMDNEKAAKCSAALLAAAMPHRTEWRQVISVPRGMEETARKVVNRVLGEEPGSAGPEERETGEKTEKKPEDIQGPAESPVYDSEREKDQNTTAVRTVENNEENNGEYNGEYNNENNNVVLFERESVFNTNGILFGKEKSLFDRDNLPPMANEIRIKPVWPAWALASLPGLGLGHLYAGKHQLFFYLIFSSILGLLFFQFTGSYFSFLLVAFSWAVDLGFAAYHVKESNKKALRQRKHAKQMEKEFLSSLDEENRGSGSE